MVAITLPRETKEFLPLTVYANDAPTADFETAVMKWPARPTGWTPAVTVDGEAGVIVDGLTVGTWTVWVRITTATESVVVRAGTIEVT